MTCNASQRRVQEKIVVVGAEASHTIKERPGQREAGGHLVAMFWKGRFMAGEKWDTAEGGSRCQKDGRWVDGEGGV